MQLTRMHEEYVHHNIVGERYDHHAREYIRSMKLGTYGLS